MGEKGRLTNVTLPQDNVTQPLEGFRRTCAVCGKPFVARHPGARYCSAACRQKAYRQRKAQGRPKRARLIER